MVIVNLASSSSYCQQQQDFTLHSEILLQLILTLSLPMSPISDI
jgi:hypothetical protein